MIKKFITKLAVTTAGVALYKTIKKNRKKITKNVKKIYKDIQKKDLKGKFDTLKDKTTSQLEVLYKDGTILIKKIEDKIKEQTTSEEMKKNIKKVKSQFEKSIKDIKSGKIKKDAKELLLNSYKEIEKLYGLNDIEVKKKKVVKKKTPKKTVKKKEK